MTTQNLAPNPFAALVAALRSALDALEHVNIGQPADELRPIALIAKEWGIEAKALIREAKRAGIAVRLGRSQVARRSDLVALADRLLAEQKAPPTGTATSYGALLEVATKRSRRAA